MAIFPDLSGNFSVNLPTGLDPRLSSVNRQNGGTPIGVLTPQFTGEIVLDTIMGQTYRATGATNTSWTPIVLGV